MLTFEIEAKQAGHSVIAGIDEAGRGPLAGPVVAAAVYLPDNCEMDGLTDSKKLTEKKRDRFYDQILEHAVCVGVGIVDHETIDAINILQATKLAMIRAVQQMKQTPDILLIDGNQTIEWDGPQKAIVKGDSLSLSIAAASVIAKVTRDRIMVENASHYTNYGFEKNKGYGSKTHLKAIEKYGPCCIHRKSFKGVREFVEAANSNHDISASPTQLDLLP